MKIIETQHLTMRQKEMLCFLWNREYPRQLAVTKEGLEEYLSQSSNQKHFVLLDDAAEMVGWAYSFDRDGDRWFSIIINSLYQGIGLGRKLMDHLKSGENRLCGWVIDHDRDILQNGYAYHSPLSFYLKNGFMLCPEERFENEKISAVKVEWTKK